MLSTKNIIAIYLSEALATLAAIIVALNYLAS
jgi:hypothetical protein